MTDKPDAFLSYTRFDDRYRKISEFRERLSNEVATVSGHHFDIFQDINGIGLGEKWQDVLDQMLDQARFFIPILTPKFFNSRPCRDELTKFLDLERRTGRQDLVLPIYWITCPVLEEGHLKAKDELAQAIDERQRWDWRELRHKAFEANEVRRNLSRLASQIERARRKVPRVIPRPPASKAKLNRSPEYNVSRAEDSHEIPGAAHRSGCFFGIFTSGLLPGTVFILDIWASSEGQLQAVEELALVLNRGKLVGQKMGVPVRRGTLINIHLEIPSFNLLNANDSLVWNGEPANASFPIVVPKCLSAGTYLGTAKVSLAGIPFARLDLNLAVSDVPNPDWQRMDTKQIWPKTAFASYASEDRGEVLARIQGMKKIAPHLDIFVDVFSLRSGEDWEKNSKQRFPAKTHFSYFGPDLHMIGFVRHKGTRSPTEICVSAEFVVAFSELAHPVLDGVSGG